MTTIDYLEKQYEHAFEMVRFGESKNSTLIAFNGAIIVGMATILKDVCSIWLHLYLAWIIGCCIVSIFIGFATLIAKIKHTSEPRVLTENDNLLYYATLAEMGYNELLNHLKTLYECEPANPNHEIDLARQVIITSQIAKRKFNLFNKALFWTVSGLLSPVSYYVYKKFFNPDKSHPQH